MKKGAKQSCGITKLDCPIVLDEKWYGGRMVNESMLITNNESTGTIGYYCEATTVEKHCSLSLFGDKTNIKIS